MGVDVHCVTVGTTVVVIAAAAAVPVSMLQTVHYPVLSSGQVLCTLDRGTALAGLLKVLSTARYRPAKATEGSGTAGHQVPQVSVYTVHRQGTVTMRRSIARTSF